MDNLILTPIPLEKLLDSFRDIIRQEIKAEQNEQLQEKLLTTKEVCDLLSVSNVTITSWVAKEKLICHSIGGRNRFKYSEIMESLKTLKKYKIK